MGRLGGLAGVTGRDPGAGHWRDGGGRVLGGSRAGTGPGRSGRGGAAVFGAGLQVAGQQAEGLDVVPGGGGGDGPHIGGQVGGPFGAGAVEVLAADHRGAQGALGLVVGVIPTSG